MAGFFARSSLLALLVLPLLPSPALSQTVAITVPNYSFDSPALPYAPPYASPEIDDWQKSPVAAWWTAAGYSAEQWTDSAGVFVNVSFEPVAAADGSYPAQLAFMFSAPGYELYQTLGNTYQVGQSYQLKVGIQGGGYGMQLKCPMAIELYYPDASGNRIPVGSTTVTNNNSSGVLSQLTDYTLTIPAVAAGSAWAGQPVGIDLVQTATTAQAGGYWDIGNVRLTATGPLAWTGSAGGNWNATEADWQQAGVTSTYADGAAVAFGDTAATGNITIQPGGVCPANVALNNQTLAYTFSGGAIAGTAGLSLNGSGTVTLQNSNTYSGGTSIDSGVLVLENSAAVSAGSLLAIGASGSLVLGTPGAAELGLLGGGGAGPLEPPLPSGGDSAATLGSVAPVPEPATLALVIAGAAVLLACRWTTFRSRRMAGGRRGHGRGSLATPRAASPLAGLNGALPGKIHKLLDTLRARFTIGPHPIDEYDMYPPGPSAACRLTYRCHRFCGPAAGNRRRAGSRSVA